MNPEQALIDAVHQVADHAQPPAGDRDLVHDTTWSKFEELGFTKIALPEAIGGSGGTVHEALSVARTLAETSIRLPVAETSLLGGWLLASAGLPLPAGPLSAGLLDAGSQIHRDPGGNVTVTGIARSVPWGSVCDQIALVASVDGAQVITAVPTASCTIHRKWNVANEPADDLVLDNVEIASSEVSWNETQCDVQTRGALIRSAQLVGAMKTALTYCAEYSTERKQFGRAIASFQAVRQMIARAAEEYSSADAALSIAAKGVDSPWHKQLVAIAKVRTGEAAAQIADVSHQVLGAIGFTEEHQLHLFTRSLWAWREEFGNESYWAAFLGEEMLEERDGSVWEYLIEILDEPMTKGES